MGTKRTWTVWVCGWGVALALGSAGAADTSGPDAGEHMKRARESIAASSWRTAMFHLNEAARQEPRNADVHNLLGYTHRKQPSPNLDKAFEHYRTALRLNPGHKGAHEYIGEAYLMARKPDEARKHLVELERLCGNQTCEEYQDLAKAIAAYR